MRAIGAIIGLVVLTLAFASCDPWPRVVRQRDFDTATDLSCIRNALSKAERVIEVRRSDVTQQRIIATVERPDVKSTYTVYVWVSKDPERVENVILDTYFAEWEGDFDNRKKMDDELQRLSDVISDSCGIRSE